MCAVSDISPGIVFNRSMMIVIYTPFEPLLP